MTKTWSIGRRGLLAAGGAGLAAPGLLVRPASAQAAWPAQPVRMVVPFAAGGPTDVPARLLAEEMSKVLPNRVVVENRTGSGVVIGTDVVAKGPQDGSMLLYSTVAHAVTRAMFPTLPFDPIADFTPCALVGQVPVILLVNNDFPARTLAEFIAVLRANPGKYDYASSGNGGALHLATELLLRALDGRALHVPYRGTAAAMPDVLNGTIPLIVDVATSALPYAQRGETRALAIMGNQRLPQLPAVPTTAEAGYPGLEAYTWHMVLAPKGTPQPVIQTMNQALMRAAALPAVQSRLSDLAMRLVTDSTPESATAWLAAETQKWTAVIREANITVN
ncbi:MAG: N-acyl-D-aspartate deacylase [Rhodospirillales bacterium 12-71-4]|nr:MAG: N-acyl-D-aspartate deacylase [Rhodospirillales bacterium 12-71-4]